MRLRARLGLTALGAAVPLVLALLRWDAVVQHRAAEERLLGFAQSHLGAGRQACEADPARFGSGPGPRAMGPPGGPPGGPRGEPPRGPPPGPPRPPPGPGPREQPARHAMPAELFVYGDDRSPASPGAPPLPRDLADAVDAGDEVAIAPVGLQSSSVELVLKAPWGAGRCAYFLARGTTDREWGALLPETEVWMLPMAVLVAAVLLAAGPAVRRIRKLTDAVKRSAEASYAGPIPTEGDDEIGELGKAFDAASRALRSELDDRRRREQALRDFLANTTHDVMTPLSALLGHLSSLRDRAAAGEPVEATTVGSAMDEAHYMASLLHNLTLAARLEASELRLQPSTVDLAALIQRVAGRHRPIARERSVSLETAVPEEPLTLEADVTLLEQAVSNVTYNAIRYNHAGGHVAVILERTGDTFSIRVLDDGPGIAEADLERLKARGARGDAARTRVPEGRGLGLHIAFQAAALHGFTLTLLPADEGGLQVTLSGPVTS